MFKYKSNKWYKIMMDVVYLAYSNNEIGYGINVVESFLTSYKSHSAGIDHNFIIIAKNWQDELEYKQLCNLAKENNAKLINLPDDGFDFGSYFRAAKILENEYIFFLGSNTEIVSDKWLLHTYKAFENDKAVQLAGPMGSWEKGSMGTSFPNYHIRTCFFMVNRKLFLEYAAAQKFPETKEDTWKLEHGPQSLTNFILKKGYKAVVVNSDGNVFSHENWISSQTYMNPGEPKHMLLDKWSNRYFTASDVKKAILEAMIWGKNITEYPKYLVKDFSSKVNIFIYYNDIIDVFTTNVFHPLFCGECNSCINTEAFQDNTGINIASKSKSYGELTGYYWVWKNYLPASDSEYVGFCQDQHFLDFNISKINSSPFRPVFITDFENIFKNYTEENVSNCIQGYDLILPEKVYINTRVYEQYLKNYTKKDMDLILNTIKEIYPQYIEATNEFMSSTSMYLPRSFIMKKDLLNEFLEGLFNILASIEQRTNDKTIKPDTVEDFSFIAEIFLNIWLVHNLKAKSLKVKTTTSFKIYFNTKDYLTRCLQEIQKAAV